MFVAATALLAAGSTRPAAASCAAPISITDALAHADIVVVGTVTATRSHDRIATVTVEETWKGAVGTTFEVFGGPDRDNEATSVDRTYQVGQRYLLFASEPAAHGNAAIFGGRYEDNSCSTTQIWDPALAQYRPATAVTAPASTRRHDQSGVVGQCGPRRNAVAVGRGRSRRRVLCRAARAATAPPPRDHRLSAPLPWPPRRVRLHTWPPPHQRQ